MFINFIICNRNTKHKLTLWEKSFNKFWFPIFVLSSHPFIFEECDTVYEYNKAHILSFLVPTYTIHFIGFRSEKNLWKLLFQIKNTKEIALLTKHYCGVLPSFTIITTFNANTICWHYHYKTF